MFRFIETIRIQGGIPQNLMLHRQRLEATFARFFPDAKVPSLHEHLNSKRFPLSEVLKCRILYNQKIIKTEIITYIPKQIESFKLVTDNSISYEYKFNDRRILMRGNNNGEEPIFVKNGLITDTSFSNLAVLLGGEWYTPAQPLLKGTMRALLLQSGQIHEKDISVVEFLSCEKFRLINAMLPLDESKDYFPSLITG